MKIKLFILTSFLISLFHVAIAQNMAWERTQQWSYSNSARFISHDQDNNLYVLGYTDGAYQGNECAGTYLCKYDALGNMLWSDTGKCFCQFDTMGVLSGDTAKCRNIYAGIATTPDGFSYIPYYQFIDKKNHVIKYDANGNIVWNKIIRSGVHEQYDSHIIADNYGNFYWADYDTINFLGKFDESGNCVWIKYVNGPGYCRNIKVLENGDIIYLGKRNSSITFDNGATLYGAGEFAVIFDTAGTIKKIMDIPEQGIKTADNQGNIYFRGVFGGTKTLGNCTIIQSAGTGYYAAKMDTAGSWVWLTELPDLGNDGWLDVDKFGNAYDLGNWYLDPFWKEYHLAKINPTGTIEWWYVSPPFNEYSSDVYSVHCDYSGNPIIAARRNLLGWVIKLNANATSLQQNEPVNIGFNVFPNLTAGIFQITYSSTEKGELQVNITKFNGQLISTESITHFNGEYKKSIDLSKQAKGVYFIEVINNKKKQVKKIVLD